jgi:hypothetical protein
MLAIGEQLGTLSDFVPKSRCELVQERGNWVGIVEKLTAGANRRHCRLEGRSEGECRGVEQQALELAPLRFSLLALLVGRPPTIEVTKEPNVVIRHSMKPIIAGKSQQGTEVLGVRWLRERF